MLELQEAMVNGYVYEVRISVAESDHYCQGYQVDHRFPNLPETETLLALRNEAVKIWKALYPELGEPEYQRVAVIYLSAREREVQNESEMADRDA